MRKIVIGRKSLMILGGVGSMIAFILASGPSIMREWSQLLTPTEEVTTAQAPATGPEPRLVSDFAAGQAAAAEPAAPVAAAPPPSVDVLKIAVPLSMSVVGEGKDQPSACAAAVADARATVTRRCERISLQNAGRRFDAAADDDSLECSGCAYVGDRWRCAARFSTQCKIYG